VTYRIDVAPRAERALRKLPRAAQKSIDRLFSVLAENPRPPGCVKLTGEERAYRVRAGDYRVVYELYDDRLVVLVVRVAHRREVYQGL
jgi:mRNA interferase RelE/StbE